jgi:hypothetical protein
MFMLCFYCGTYLIPATVCCLAAGSVLKRQVDSGVGGFSQQHLFCLLPLRFRAGIRRGSCVFIIEVRLGTARDSCGKKA